MSSQLWNLATRFVNSELSADKFSDMFITQWKAERDSGELLHDPDGLSERLSSIFCLADLYNPASDREEYELDESKLLEAVGKTMKT